MPIVFSKTAPSTPLPLWFKPLDQQGTQRLTTPLQARARFKGFTRYGFCGGLACGFCAGCEFGGGKAGIGGACISIGGTGVAGCSFSLTEVPSRCLSPIG